MSGVENGRFLRVLSRARNCRSGYLVDSNNTPEALLDAIFASNLKVWGGRLNPIIPVIEGEILPQHWALLRLCDPDSIYTYVDLPQTLTDRIQREIDPLRLEKHAQHLLDGTHPLYEPQNMENLIPSDNFIAYEMKANWDQERTLITYDSPTSQPSDPLIARNFGILAKHHRSWRIPTETAQLSFGSEADFASFLQIVSTSGAKVVFPFALAASNALVPSSDIYHDGRYTIFVGNAVSDWLAHWNHIFTLGLSSRTNWKTLCLPAELLNSSTLQSSLIQFLKKLLRRNGDRPPYLDWISSTHTETELKDICGPLMGKKIDAHFRFVQRDRWAFPDVRPRPSVSFNLPGSLEESVQRVSRSGGLLAPPQLPAAIKRSGRRMQDVRVEYLAEHRFYVNEELVYRLPRRIGMSQAIFPGYPGRTDCHGNVSVEMLHQSPLTLQVADDHELLLRAVGCLDRISFKANLSWSHLSPEFEYTAPSDKGRYCHGVLDLFGGLHSASRILNNSFWRKIFEELAGRKAGASETLVQRAINRIRKNERRWFLQEDATADANIERIARYIVDLAHEVGTKEGEVTLQFLERSFDREYKDYLEANPDFSTDGTDSPGVVRASYLASLSRTLQDFLDAGILRQGVVSRCSRCGSRIWKELSQIRQQHSCDGCGAMVRTKAESQWVYRLNSLVKNAIALHGTVALVCGLAALRQRSRNSFIFSTGIAFYEHFDDKEAAAEADVICVTDGELWVGEIKTDAKDFNSAEIQKLISLATRLGADKAFIFALNGDQKRLKDLCDAASDSNDSAIVIEFLRSAGSPLHSVMAV